QLVRQTRRARENELDVWTLRPNPQRRIDQAWQDRADLVGTASRQERDDRLTRRKTKRREESLTGFDVGHDVQERMPDPLDRNAGLTVERLLELEDHQDAVGDPFHRLHPAGSPGPELRTDVVDDRYAQPPHCFCEAEIEIRN